MPIIAKIPPTAAAWEEERARASTLETVCRTIRPVSVITGARYGADAPTASDDDRARWADRTSCSRRSVRSMGPEGETEMARMRRETVVRMRPRLHPVPLAGACVGTACAGFLLQVRGTATAQRWRFGGHLVPRSQLGNLGVGAQPDAVVHIHPVDLWLGPFVIAGPMAVLLFVLIATNRSPHHPG
jgi:hypothetical protein